jgi:Holliday junction resolvase RusA-like endonuclease
MIEKITLKWNSISTQNAYGNRGKIRYMLPKARETKTVYQIQARSQRRGKPKLQWDLFIYIKIYFGNKMKHDRDNRHKISCDSLEWIVYENDSQIRLTLVELWYDKENPRQEIMLCKLEDKKQLIDYYLTKDKQNIA